MGCHFKSLFKWQQEQTITVAYRWLWQPTAGTAGAQTQVGGRATTVSATAGATGGVGTRYHT